MHSAVVLHLTGVVCLAANQAVKYLGSQGGPGWKAPQGINHSEVNLRGYNTNLQDLPSWFVMHLSNTYKN